MQRPLETRQDIELLVTSFYDKAKKDSNIGHFFNDVVHIDWDNHLPRMFDFWETTLFHKRAYSGSPVPVHESLHAKSPMTAEHFERWVALFHATIDEHFSGPNAEMAKQRSKSIATIMQIKVQHKRA